MNKYLFYKVFCMLRIGWKVHLSVMLQVMVGIAVIYAGVTINLSIQDRYKHMQKDIKSMVWDIDMYSDKYTDESPLTYEQYQTLKNEMPEASFPFHVIHRIYFVGDKQDVQIAYLLFVTDDFLNSAYRIEQPGFESGSQAYIGSYIEDILNNKYKIIKQDVALSLNEQHLLELNGKIQQLELIRSMKINTNHFETEDYSPVPLEHIALIPIRYYYSLFNQKDTGSFRLSVQLDHVMSEEEATSSVMQVIEKLLIWNGEHYSYNVKTPVQHLLLQIEQIRSNSILSSAIAGLCLLIVLLGLTGLINVVFARRKVGLAIASAMGGSKKMLFLELLLEVSLPSFIGGIIGTGVCSFYLYRYVHFEAFELHQSGLAMFYITSISLLPGIIAAGTLVYRIRRLKPIEIIRGE